MRSFAPAFVLILLCSSPFAALTYVGTYNGSNPDDSGSSEKFISPSALFYLEGKLYVSDFSTSFVYVMDGNYAPNATSRLRLITPKNDEGALSNPTRMEAENGVLYVADGTTGKIKYYSGQGSTIELWNTASNIGKATGLAMDNQSFYITDGQNGRLLVYSRQNRAYSNVGLEKGGSDGQLSSPSDVRLYGEKFYISDADKNLLFVYDSGLKFEYTVGRGKGGVELRSPRGIKIHQDRIYVADRNQNRVVVFTLDGYPIETLNRSPSANFSYPEDVAVGDGKLYVADTGNGLVHIFAINYSIANDSVLFGIGQAKKSAESLRETQQAAGKLGLAYENLSFDAQLASAQDYYDRLLFSSASALSQGIADSANAAQAALGMQIDVRARQMAKQAADKVAPYRQTQMDASLASELAAIDSASSQLQTRLLAKDYAQAAELASGLLDSADAFVAGFEGKSAERQAEEKSQRLQSLIRMRDSLGARVAAAKAKSDLYRQVADFANLERLLGQASGEISSGSLDAANNSLYLATIETVAFETTLAASAKEIDAALANLTVVEFEMNASVSRPMLLPANMDAERQMLAQARLAAYSNPQLGLAMAAQAREAAKVKVKDAQTLSVAAAALLMMMGLIGAISAAFYLHLRSRQRKLDASHGKEEEGKRKK